MSLIQFPLSSCLCYKIFKKNTGIIPVFLIHHMVYSDIHNNLTSCYKTTAPQNASEQPALFPDHHPENNWLECWDSFLFPNHGNTHFSECPHNVSESYSRCPVIKNCLLSFVLTTVTPASSDTARTSSSETASTSSCLTVIALD